MTKLLRPKPTVALICGMILLIICIVVFNVIPNRRKNQEHYHHHPVENNDDDSSDDESEPSAGCSLNGHHKGACRSLVQSGNLLPVNDPEHNLREIIKQFILVEDHLFQTDKQCVQCIAKHLIGIEAYAEEGISLDTTKRYVVLFRNIISAARDLQKTWQSDATEAAQRVRELRRTLMDKLT